MAIGRFSDSNLTAAATLSGGAWPVAGLGLNNLKDDQDYIGAPARCADNTSLANSKFEVLLAEPRLVSLVVLLFHTMGRSAKYRITISTAADPTYAAPLLQTAWEWVFPSIFDPVDLEFGLDNFWDGAVSASELDLYPRNLWAPFAEVLAERIRIELDDRNNAAGYFDIGGCWIASGWSPTFNFERGRELAVNARDVIDEAPSGRFFAEERTPRRQLAVSYEMLSDAEAQRWVDAGMRARTTRTVLFAPDLDDAAALMREGFPGVFERPPGARFTYSRVNSTAITFKEILA